ncbi:hypothetical protein DMB66_33220 [Actinoplanes sp. ATCC 53533]|uniref:hypothetical protein n=1 Tax=Actinoplanes sp. ATCC 53533 TaxID=1288362 RepID=UPI000F7A9C3A|nr:hypothetical protein [Actinoplanes sp. ATCC 53533]RSM56712.1 hypothetical protein DMB66_33220 [Actinoplanes sp. ATCC 53533]
MTELVGVHGMAKHQLGRHQLASAWAPALADGLERAADRRVERPPLEVAFYGDIFLPDIDATTKSGEDGALLDGLDGPELTEVEQALREAVTDAELVVADRDVRHGKGYTRVPRPLQVLLRAVDNRCGAAAGILYVGVLRQVHRYLTDPEVKAKVDDRVAQAVDESCRVLIGHSLGSVVAYELLRQRPGHRVELFVTMGSPLGLRMVRSRLSAAPLAVPAWVNLRDLRDPVACAGELRRWWPQIGPDGEIVVDNGGDTHAVERYLSRGRTGRVILERLPHLAGA